MIANALKFSSPERLPHIRIKSEIGRGETWNVVYWAGVERLLPEENYCHFSVSDNGIGFDAEYSTLIFDLFQRLHDKDEYEGTGIGLSIVKKIVENHHGCIMASSEPGQGARFDFFIPALSD